MVRAVSLVMTKLGVTEYMEDAGTGVEESAPDTVPSTVGVPSVV